jgi:uncharacterized membrane protein
MAAVVPTTTSYLAAIALFLFVDSFWLLTGGIWARQIAQAIQGRPVSIRYLSAAVVYIALAYIIHQATSVTHAAALGVATYAVYDFTTHAILTNYDWRFAVADTLWGGILFAAVYMALRSFGFA